MSLRLLAVVFACGMNFRVDAAPLVPGLAHHPEMRSELVGTVLLGELRCAACHEVPGSAMSLVPAPDLSQVASRLEPGYIRRFLADPQATRTGSVMPDMLSALGAEAREEAAEALTHFLASLPQAEAGPVRNDLRNPGKIEASIARGQEHYHQIGCVACHGAEGGPPILDEWEINGLVGKFRPGALAKFLLDPLAAHPSGRMPDLHLAPEEASDLAAYLTGGKEPEQSEEFVVDPILAATGRKLFAEHRCVSCHDLAGLGPALGGSAIRSLDGGCLASEPSTEAAHYRLAPTQVTAIRSALKEAAPAFSADERIEIALTSLNCNACHVRDDFGGPDETIEGFFTTTNPSLGDQARIPPALTGVGAKLKPDWLRKVLVDGESVRPYMTTRMPRFGSANIDALPALFAAADVEDLPQLELDRNIAFDRERMDEIERSGRELAGEAGFGCVACHSFLGETATTLNALDLTQMHPRLTENWFHTFLREPERIHPETIMPNYWPNSTSTRPEVLDGSRDHQIDAIWRYLSRGREGSPPRGIRPEPIPVRVNGEEAVMLRRQYDGIGKRGIGVGYPARVNLSFDAGQMRLAAIWRGDFVDATAVWSGQGAGNVQLAGTDLVKFPRGPALARLDGPAAAWPESDELKAPGFRWLGYTLDQQRRPTFRYAFGETKIHDQFLDVREPTPSFVRTLTIAGAGAHGSLHLRVAVGSEIKESGENRYQIGDRLRVDLPAAGIVRKSASGAGEFELLLPLSEGSASIRYRWEPS